MASYFEYPYFEYVMNDPLWFIDPFGLCPGTWASGNPWENPPDPLYMGPLEPLVPPNNYTPLDLTPEQQRALLNAIPGVNVALNTWIGTTGWDPTTSNYVSEQEQIQAAAEGAIQGAAPEAAETPDNVNNAWNAAQSFNNTNTGNGNSNSSNQP